ncbi:hypothetical protein ZWY2020_004215 [Hordeum vulgare]|nr:hypothetical protein ZWY2020_004215 [Hordeum vulgare]
MTLTNADLADPEAHAASVATTAAFLLGSTDGPAPDAAGVDDDDVTAGLLQYGLVQSKPSMVAAAVVYVARLTLKMTPLWIDTLRHHTGFTEAQLMDAAKILIGGHGMKPRFFGQETRQRSCRWHGR